MLNNRGYIATAYVEVDEGEIIADSLYLLQQKLGDQRFAWFESRNLVKGKVMSVELDNTRKPFANCATFDDAKKVSSSLSEAVPQHVHETIIEVSVSYFPLAARLKGEREKRYAKVTDQVEGTQGFNDLIADLSRNMEFAGELLELHWGEEVDFYMATEGAAHLLLEYLLDEDPASLDMHKLAILALLDNFVDEDEMFGWVAENFAALPLTEFVRTAYTGGVISELAKAEVFADAFMLREEKLSDDEKPSIQRQEDVIDKLAEVMRKSDRSVEAARKAGAEACEQLHSAILSQAPTI